MFRFSLTQLLLLFVLVGILGGLLTAAYNGRLYFEYQDMAVSPDGKIAVMITSRGFQMVDLQTGHASAENLTTQWRPFNEFTSDDERLIVFGDDGTFSFIIPASFEESVAGKYSIASSSLLAEFAFENYVAPISGLVNPEQCLLGKDFICRRPERTKTFRFFNLNETSTELRHSFDPTTVSRITDEAATPEEPESAGTQTDATGPDDDSSAAPANSDENSADAPRVNSKRSKKSKSEPGTWNVNVDGSRLVAVKRSSLEVWNPLSKELLFDIPLEEPLTNAPRQTRFAGPNQILLIDSSGYSLFDCSQSPPMRRWKFKMDATEMLRPDAVFSNDQLRVAVSKRVKGAGKQIIVLDVASGDQVFETPALPYSRLSFFGFDINNDLLTTAKNSDRGLTKWNLTTGKSQNIFGHYRFPIGVLFVLLLTGWAAIWGRLARKAERKQTTSSAQKAMESIAEHPLDSSSVIVEKDKLTKNIVTDVEMVQTYGQAKADRNLQICWNLMMIGGIAAIAWSIIPLFVVHSSGYFGQFLENIFTVRIVLMMFGLVVGLMATARGTGRYHHMLRMTAGLQLFHMINFDFLNFIFGSIETVLLNRDETLETVSKAISTQTAASSPEPVDSTR